MTEQPNRLVFDDVNSQWELMDSRMIAAGARLFCFRNYLLAVSVNDDILYCCEIETGSDSAWSTKSGCGRLLIACRKPPEPKYVPFANAEEARLVVGWEPWIRRKIRSDGLMKKVGGWTDQGIYGDDFSSLHSWYEWSNTPDDPASWEPFGKLATE